MKKMEIYQVYMEGGNDCYKITVPAESKAAAIKYVEGNGEVVAVKKETGRPIDLLKLSVDLKNSGWGQTEIDIVTRALFQVLKETIN